MNPLIVPCAGLRDHVKKQVLWRKPVEGNTTKNPALSAKRNQKQHENASISNREYKRQQKNLRINDLADRDTVDS